MKSLTVVFAIVCLCLASLAPAESFVDAKIAFRLARSGDPGGTFAGSVRFLDRPTDAQIRQVEDLGVRFIDYGKGRLGSRTVFPVRIPFAAVRGLAALDFLAAVESEKKVAPVPMLYNSNPQVQADLAWQVPSPLGGTLSGRGVTIGDIDTGIDYFHPLFFKLSNDQYGWLDADGNGILSEGDAVDLNGNGSPDAGESLRYIEATTNTMSPTYFPNDPDIFNSDFDFLYNDANGNLDRDFGPPRFTESDPCFGELLFVVNDDNDNRSLDPGETLQALGESKVRAIFDHKREVYTREEDLLDADLDMANHGTPVTGILGGGWVGRHAMSGIAPGAEFLCVNMQDQGLKLWESEDSWDEMFMEGTAWLVSEGADIILDEFGTFVWEFLDGSSNTEMMINEFTADQGIIYVAPNGNLAGKTLHCVFDSAEGQVLRAASDATELYVCLLWTDPSDLAVSLTTPEQVVLDVPGDGKMLKSGNYQIYTNFSVSPRGTRRMDLWLTSGSGSKTMQGDWVYSFSGPATRVTGNFQDQNGAWESESSWTSNLTDYFSISLPATADSAMNVGAYDNIGIAVSGDPAWSICNFSSTGPRIDGARINDLAAPGIFVIAPHIRSGGDLFGGFAGTSCAGPFVAGAAALMKELVPDLDNGACRKYLREGAEKIETYTDFEHWGAGSLRINAALAPLLADKAAQPPAHPELQLSAYPNPFNPQTVIGCYLPGDGEARLRIFGLDGREVWTAALAAGRPGWREVTWEGVDAMGRGVASGVYFAHVMQAQRYMVTKLTLIK